MSSPDNSVPHRATLSGHFAIARVDHWVKNVFVLPGVAAALSLDPTARSDGLPGRLALGLLAVGLVASSNYTLNEIVDAPFDRHHPDKQSRPVPSGTVNIPLAYVQWLLLAAAGLLLSAQISSGFTIAAGLLWVMGCVYNIRPVRTKDLPYLDVLTEAVNNPLRLLAGWYIVSAVPLPPATLIISYWMIGCYFMAIKRYSERREIGDIARVAAYRKSLATLSPEQLLTTIVFYASTAMLCFGGFIMRYRIEEVLAFPPVALVMALYLKMGFKEHSAAQHPERLYREPALMAAVILCSLVMGTLLFVNIPWLHSIFSPTVPTMEHHP